MRTNLIVLLLILVLPGCSKFLEESSQDEVRPSTIDDMIELMNGEGYPEVFYDFFTLTDIFTDDVQCNGKVGTKPASDVENGRWKFSWDKDMFETNGGGSNPFYWEYAYAKIKGCNLILDYIDQMTGTPTSKESLRGEALVMRGYYYLMLVNFFGQPYNVGNPEKNLGVPLKLRLGVTEELFPRNTVAQVYRQIEDDLLKGNRLMEENVTPRSLMRVDHLAAKALLSRMYLYMGNWDKALEYTEKVLASKSKLLKFCEFKNTGSPQNNEGVYVILTGDEIIWARPDKGMLLSSIYKNGYGVSSDLTRSYEQRVDGKGPLDLRYDLYFVKAYDIDWVSSPGILCKDRENGSNGIRTAEMYLNRAECYIRKFMESGENDLRMKALADLNKLREHRYDTRTIAYVPVDITDKDALFQFYKEERRRELCGESNHRWFDLRRYGMPELKHVYFVKAGETQEYTLDENSPRYVLRIPGLAMEYNRMLEQNP